MLTTLKFRVTPNAPKNRVVGEINGEIRIKIRAPATDGKANNALIEYLSELTNLPKSMILIKTGATARVKLIQFNGLDPLEIKRRLDTG